MYKLTLHAIRVQPFLQPLRDLPIRYLKVKNEMTAWKFKKQETPVGWSS